MLDACDDVKRSSEQLKVGSISAKYTTLEVNLDGEAYYQAIKNALDTAEDNKEIKEYMQRLGELTGEADLYDKYLDGLKDGREELGDGSEVKESDAAFFMKVYVDSVGEIKGREITVSDSGESATFTNLMPQKGSAYEYESRFTLNGTEYYKITGDGKRSGGKLKGNFGFNLNPELMPSEISSYIYSMSDVLTMEIKDLDENKLEKGLLSGKFSFSTSIPIVSVYSLDLDIDQAEKGGSFKITCRQADDVLASVSSTIKQTGAPKVDKPKSGDRLYDASSGGGYDGVRRQLSVPVFYYQ